MQVGSARRLFPSKSRVPTLQRNTFGWVEGRTSTGPDARPPRSSSPSSGRSRVRTAPARRVRDRGDVPSDGPRSQPPRVRREATRKEKELVHQNSWEDGLSQDCPSLGHKVPHWVDTYSSWVGRSPSVCVSRVWPDLLARGVGGRGGASLLPRVDRARFPHRVSDAGPSETDLTRSKGPREEERAPPGPV